MASLSATTAIPAWETLEAAPYELAPVDGSASRHGTLLRARWPDVGCGYADLHPWPELGQASLTDLLGSLARREPLPLARRSLALARQDAIARANGVSLFRGLEVPRSHSTAWNPETLTDAHVAELARLGFDTLKLKVSPATLPTVVELATTRLAGWRLRLDANARFDETNVSRLLRAVETLGDRVDFVEDPTPDGTAWGRLDVRQRVAWASDWVSCPDPDVIVLKAHAVEPLGVLGENTALPDRWVVTSALDHPVGQAFAAWEAARVRARYGDWVDTCGLATHLVYERNSFSDRMTIDGGRLLIASGTGIGFDDLWATLPWTSLPHA